MAPQILPSGVNAAALGAFFSDVAARIGDDNVSRDASTGALEGPNGQRDYGDAFPLGRDHTPSGAVRPATVGEVQHVLKAANKHRIPLWTVSRGKNLGYGGTAPVVKGSVVLDLHRMKKIIEINEEYAYAIVEPGVTFFDLFEEIKRRGLALWSSAPSIGWGSIIGNTLERGFGYTPDGEHSQAQCGMEVVLPNGDVVRTGMGAMDGSKLFPLFKGGFGPNLDGLFCQSNLGVVTKMGVHITPAPEAFIRVEVTFPEEHDLVPLTGILTDLLRRRIITQSPSLMNIVGLSFIAAKQDPEVAARLGPFLDKHIPESVLLEVQALKKLPYWLGLFSLYGSQEVVQAQLATLTREFSTRTDGRATVKHKLFIAPPGKRLDPSVIGDEPEILPQTGRPTLASLELMHLRGQNGGHVAFAPILPPSGREMYDWYLEAKRLTSEAGFNFVADFHVFARYVIAIDLIMYRPQDEQQAMNELMRKLTDITTKKGFSEYRTHVSLMDDVAKHYAFNGHALGRLTRTLKDVLDPNGILSPGKQGVWNSSDRNATKL